MESFYDKNLDFIRVKGIEEPAFEQFRHPFARDFSRLIHCPSYRRLGGKMQAFPGAESDFFRNRLTHSNEVADVARIIAQKINNTDAVVKHWAQEDKLNLDLISFTGNAHDIGHPPFGHVGERVLDKCMEQFGRFEGNAQTLRILAKLEKKQTLADTPESYDLNGINRLNPRNIKDERLGLNLTYRSILSILKYDSLLEIPKESYHELDKGYYSTEQHLLHGIKEKYSKHYSYSFSDGEIFRTIECDIMDLADDIAFTTYDLEDALKVRFINILDFFDAAKDSICEDILIKLHSKINKLNSIRVNGEKIYNSELKFENFFGTGNVASQIMRLRIRLYNLFKTFIPNIDDRDKTHMSEILADESRQSEFVLRLATQVFHNAKSIMTNGYWRRVLTSSLVRHFIEATKFHLNTKAPIFSKVYLEADAFIDLEILKNFIFQTQVKSNRIQIVEYRARDILNKIFTTLSDRENKGYELLPQDYKQIYSDIEDTQRPRIICDFIAGMTDIYAVEFYGRLVSEDPQTIFKPF